MNLREMYSFTGTLLGDPANQNVARRPELLMYLNRGQHIVSGLLWNIEREKFLTTNSQAAVASTADYVMPIDVREIKRVTYNNVQCKKVDPGDLEALSVNTMERPMKGYNQYYSLVSGSVGKFKITIYPTPDDTSSIKVWYYRKPIEFHERGTYDGTVTTSTSTTVFTDTAAPFKGTTGAGLDTFWVDATVRFTAGPNINQTKRVVSWVANTGVFTTEAFTDAPGTNTYELDQVSIIPDEHHHLVCFYAAYLAATKLGKGAPWMDQFNMEMEMNKTRWLDNIEASLPGEVNTGMVRRAKSA